jgi:hypothetical protein
MAFPVGWLVRAVGGVSEHESGVTVGFQPARRNGKQWVDPKLITQLPKKPMC